MRLLGWFQPTRPRGARRPAGRKYGTGSCRFNPRAREGRDAMLAIRACRSIGFNPRAREGRDRRSDQLRKTLREFQPTRPRGARPDTRYRPNDPGSVSTHAPARGTTFPGRHKTPLLRSFNPRAREGRDHRGRRHVCHLRTVSTHAPARGATRTWLMHVIVIEVSTHAPARGATATSDQDPADYKFQPTRPRGARRDDRARMTHANRFNPRAREGRDSGTGAEQSTRLGFNPRAREGRDLTGACCAISGRGFQPTRPRGARHGSPATTHAGRRFNPRAREGRDIGRAK